ncbi:MAG TPA: hypothetical protein VG520_09990 [Candidatus Dormibacteraeota bacterium]|nr:hypothetical protein [Candidatus Dormibacteraeota bacterium]
MKVLPTVTPLDSDEVSVSYGGLVDRDTACAGDVALWCDAEIIESVQRAAAAKRPEPVLGWHAA